MAHATRSVGATIRVWDVPVRLFHWSLVVAIALAFVSSEEDSPLAAWHMVAGWVAAVLIGFRLCWGFIGNAQARFANFVKPAAVFPHLRELIAGRPERSIGHNPLGGLAVLALLAGTAAVTWTGIRMTSGGGSEDLHEILAFSLLGLIVVHIVGVVVMSLLTHDNLAQAMVTGRKAAHGGQLPVAPRRFRMLAHLGGVAIVGLLVLGVIRYDAGAFIPGSREEAEHAEQHAALGGPVLEANDDD
ncbi:cytochrome b/b6 domain-containing protein [Blastomonas sp. AAP53]|uniref:cytochrome b/b6 domain-containing protein n=1 Tax=Blastomonas sp. AAP53 TaxID=1248760 RepID=UPI0003772242|nr:cytochrome b/b6 domain-containing protein [Blastomonas sp. AAP53]